VAVTTTVYLVRHAAHDRVDRVLCGRMPGVTLGPEGRAQAERLAERFSRERIAAIVSSPLERARETAETIAERLGLELRISDDLDEIDFGHWTGLSFEALAPDPRWAWWNRERNAATAPGGESMGAAQARILREVERVRDEFPDAGVILVSHCDVIKAALAHFLELPLQAYELFEIGPASVSVLALWPGGAKILGLNDMAAA
jgi:broad specificity phosphatase PhoE